MKTLALILCAFGVCGSSAKAYLLVEDLPNLGNNIRSQVQDYAQYILQSARQLQLVTNSVTQIENQVIQLRRFGDPSYYVNLLGLGPLMQTASILTSGVGETIATYRQAANGLQALQYTGGRLYNNLQGTVDRWGNPVQYNQDAFRQYGTVDSMVDDYSTQQRTYDSQSASLQQQLTTAMQNLNSASDLVSTIKYQAQVNAISAQINALGHTTALTGQRAEVQHTANLNNTARMQEATVEQEKQERATDLEMESRGFSNLIGGGGNNENNGILP